MTDRWVTNNRYWCDYCQKFIKNTKADKAHHENGNFHKMNVQNKLKKIQEDEKQRREDERQLQKELTYAAKNAARQEAYDAGQKSESASKYSTWGGTTTTTTPASTKPTTTAPLMAQPGTKVVAPVRSEPQPEASQYNPQVAPSAYPTQAYPGYTQYQQQHYDPLHATVAWQAYYAQMAQYAKHQQPGMPPTGFPPHPAHLAAMSSVSRAPPPAAASSTPVPQNSSSTHEKPTAETKIEQEVAVVTPVQHNAKEARNPGQWEEVTDDAYSSYYRPASPEKEEEPEDATVLKKRKRDEDRDEDEYDDGEAPIDFSGKLGEKVPEAYRQPASTRRSHSNDDDSNDDTSTFKRRKSAGTEIKQEFDDDDADTSDVVWKKKTTVKKQLRKRNL